MAEPHVVALHYRLVTGPTFRFQDAPPVEWETPAGAIRIAEGRAKVELAAHYDSEEDARRAVEPHLRAWIIRAGIEHTGREMGFEFDRAELEDRAPPVPGALKVRGVSAVSTTGHAAATLVHHTSARLAPRPGFACGRISSASDTKKVLRFPTP